MASTGFEFEELVEHLKSVIEDIETIHSAKEMIYKLKSEILDLLRIVMHHAELESVDIPPSVHGGLPKFKGREVESIALDRSGVLILKKKEGGISSVHEVKDLPTETLITIFNAVTPILRETISNQRKLHEKRLEALQTIKESLAGIEKRRSHATHP